MAHLANSPLPFWPITAESCTDSAGLSQGRRGTRMDAGNSCTAASGVTAQGSRGPLGRRGEEGRKVGAALPEGRPQGACGRRGTLGWDHPVPVQRRASHARQAPTASPLSQVTLTRSVKGRKPELTSSHQVPHGERGSGALRHAPSSRVRHRCKQRTVQECVHDRCYAVTSARNQ